MISKTKLLHTAFGLKDAHHSIVDGSEVIVDYCRQQLMPGWIPRRLGMFPCSSIIYYSEYLR